MKYRAITLVVALYLSCFAVFAIAQENQTPTPNSQDQQVQTQPAQTQSTDAAQSSEPQLHDKTAKEVKKDKEEKEKEKKKEAKDGPEEHIKKGSIDDVNAIGNRKVGGRGIGDWYSLDSEIAMGKQYAQQVESSVKLIKDPVVTEYVNRIGQNLVRNSDAKVPFTIKVIDSDEINAFALPGGFFYVNSGLILAADDEAELAGVMAHEIAHVAARHATRQMTRAQIANLGSIPLIFMGGWAGYAIRSAAGFALPMTFLTFSRGFEAQADFLGLQYMYKTGYDPQAFISFFEKLQAKEKKKPGTIAKAFSTHPQTPDRIEKSQEEIAKILPPKSEYILDTSDFEQVKARLARIENKRKIIDEKDSKAPSLRRATNTDDSKTDNGRPTLKRRDN